MSTDATFIGGCAVIFLCSTLAAAGGIGGGALNVPVLISVFQFDYKKSVVLSLCAVFGNVISQVFVNWKRRHPLDASRPLIYWDVALLLIPSQLGGNNLGVVLGAMLPTTILLILAVLVINFAVYKTISKGRHLHNIETKALAAAANPKKAEGEDRSTTITVEDSQVGDVAMRQTTTQNDTEAAAAAAAAAAGTSVNPMMAGVGARAAGGGGGGGGEELRDSTASVLSTMSTAGEAQFDYGQQLLLHGQESSRVNPLVVVLEGPAAGASAAGGVRVVVEEKGHTDGPGSGLERMSIIAPQPTHAGDMTGRDTVVTLRDVTMTAHDLHSHAVERMHNHTTRLSAASQAAMQGSPSMAMPRPPGVAGAANTAATQEEEVKMLVPTTTIMLIFMTLIFFACISLAMTLETKCSAAYWSTLALSYPVLAVFVHYSIERIAKAQSDDPSSILFGDVNVTQDRLSRPVMAFIIGIVCSLLGIGGGELFGPFLLAMKVIPQVSSATTSVMSLVSSLNNIIHHMILGNLPYGEALALFLVGMSGGATGRIGALHITKLFGRPSILIFILGTILAISGMILLVDVITEPTDFELASACAQ